MGFDIERFCHFKALFGIIPMLEMFCGNSLMFHDVCEMIKLIDVTKWINRQTTT